MNGNSRLNTCDAGRFESYFNGDLNDAEERAFLLHLNTCESCRETLEQRAADSATWFEAAKLLKPCQYDLSTRDDDHDESIGTGRLPLQIQSVLATLGPTDDPAMLGRIGAYEVSGVIGSGGMGIVLKAVDKSLERTVAIKVLAPHLASSGAARKRFGREAKAAAAVLHPNVIAIHSVSNDETLPFIVMPYVRGTSLQKRLDSEGALSVPDLLRIGIQVAAGLAAAHSQGLVHRDIKPANILLEEGVERVTLTDFGLARAVDDATLTQSGVIAGTPQYMSPEQARGEAVDSQSDLFSLGSVLYAISTGQPPFRAETTYGVMRRITDDEPTPIRELDSDIPAWLQCIVQKLMSKQRADRFESAAHLETLLKQCLAHLEQPQLVSLPKEVDIPAVRPFTFSPRRIAMSAAALSLLSALGWFTVNQLNPTPSRDTPVPQPQAQQPAIEKENSPRASTQVDKYKIEVVGVADISGLPMTTEFDMSRMKVNQQFQEFGHQGNGGFVGGGGAGGGFTGKFNKPNLGIALKIESTNSSTTNFVKLGTKVSATDDQGNTIESKDLGPVINHFAQFEQKHPDTQFLYVFRGPRKGSKLVRLEGELLVTPGRRLAISFDGTKKQTKSVQKEAFTLESVKTTADGIQVAVVFPQPKSTKDARTAQERFGAIVANRGSKSVTIEDSEGDVYQASGSTNVGGGTQQTFSFNGPTTKGSIKSADDAPHSFRFAPLPEGRTIKAIHAAFEDRTGDAKLVPFTLENVSLDQ